MPIKLMYCTNRPEIATIAEHAGVGRIWVDMERIGKAERQRRMDTVQSDHTPEDVAAIRAVLKKAELVVRVNPLHEGAAGVLSSREEIDRVCKNGADLVMLPYFKTADEVRRFADMVDGRAKVYPLLETPEAVAVLDEILSIDGIDEIHVGLNDLTLGSHKRFLFEPLADGTVDDLCARFAARGIPYGFGGFCGIGNGEVPAEYVISEHYRLGSTRAILSRTFCKPEQFDSLETVSEIFETGLCAIRACEAAAEDARRAGNTAYFEENRAILCDAVARAIRARAIHAREASANDRGDDRL